MSEELRINVEWTKQDVKNYFFDVNRTRFLIWLVVYAAIVVFFAVFVSVLLPGMISLTLFTTAFCIVVFGGMFGITTYIQYRRILSQFQDGNIIGKSLVYQINTSGYTFHSQFGYMTVNWADIRKLVENRTIYRIGLSVGKEESIPKRFFSGQAELDRFNAIVSGAVDEKKIKLKNYKFHSFSPVSNEDIPTTADKEYDRRNKEMASSGNELEPIMTFKVVPTKQEYISFNFLHTYTTPPGIFITIIGILLLLFAGFQISDAAELNMFRLVMWILIGVIMVLGTPVLIFAQANRIYKSDASFRNGVIYSFYDNYIEIFADNGKNTRLFGDFRKLKRYSRYYLMFISNRQVYIIPTRCIEDKAAFEGYFQHMKSENRRLKDTAKNRQP